MIAVKDWMWPICTSEELIQHDDDGELSDDVDVGHGQCHGDQLCEQWEWRMSGIRSLQTPVSPLQSQPGDPQSPELQQLLPQCDQHLPVQHIILARLNILQVFISQRGESMYLGNRITHFSSSQDI